MGEAERVFDSSAAIEMLIRSDNAAEIPFIFSNGARALSPVAEVDDQQVRPGNRVTRARSHCDLVGAHFQGVAITDFWVLFSTPAESRRNGFKAEGLAKQLRREWTESGAMSKLRHLDTSAPLRFHEDTRKRFTKSSDEARMLEVRRKSDFQIFAVIHSGVRSDVPTQGRA